MKAISFSFYIKEEVIMFARLTITQSKPDKRDEVTKIFRESVVPAAKSQKGYRGIYLLNDPKTGKGISITLWDSEADAVTDEKSTLHQEQVDMYKGLLIGEHTAQYFEVSATDKIG